VNQLIGIGVAVLFAVAGTLVSLKLADMLIGLRVSETEEIAGLDATQHGEAAYVFETISLSPGVQQAKSPKANDDLSSGLTLEPQ